MIDHKFAIAVINMY